MSADPFLAQLQAALADHQAGRLDQADMVYREVLHQNPNHIDAMHLRGVLLAQRNRLTDALPLLQRAVAAAPQVAEFQLHLAETLALLGRPSEALNHFVAVLRIDPRHVPARSGVAAALLAMGHTSQSVEQFAAAAQLQPNNAALIGNWGFALMRNGQLNDAIARLRNAVQIDPNMHGAWLQLAEAVWRSGQYEEAVAPARRAVELDPKDLRSMVLLGNTLQTAGEMPESAEVYRRAIALDPTSSDAHVNLALVLLKSGRAKESLDMYDAIIARWPAMQDARANRALALLTLGDFDRGLTEYEARWHSPALALKLHPGQKWDGTDPAAKTILLASEQGHGDTIQFVRYAQLIAERGATVIVSADTALHSVLRTVPGVSRVTEPGDEPAFDAVAQMASLPRLMGTRIETIPANVPYISADIDRIEKWKHRIQGEGSVKIGIVWAGSRLHQNDRMRSCKLTDFAPLADLNGVALYSLQKGDVAGQIADVKFPVKPLGDELFDFGDTAALLACLDLLISVDTSVVHLAGAMGRPVWTLISAGPDFRWMLDRDDSPWYPAMRLFRQAKLKDWKSVFERVAGELRTFTSQRKQA